MIFWIGFFIMFFNEGFVMMRHVSPWAAKQRQNLIDKYGQGWQTFHGMLDYLWVIFITLGFIFSPHKGSHLYIFICFWLLSFLLIYLPQIRGVYLNNQGTR
jgi:hypothetical protein